MNEEIRVAVHSDVGVRKKVNQDSLMLISADTDVGILTLVSVCDGMGGLEAGEKASAAMTAALREWFANSLAAATCLDGSMITYERFQKEIDELVHRTADEIDSAFSMNSGTTMTAVLIGAGRYYTANVGDSRVYLFHDSVLRQLTKDQTVVQMKIDKGIITEEEALTDPERNVLLQCVGSCDKIAPEYTEGACGAGDSFLLCSDGFRHKLTTEEIGNALKEGASAGEMRMKEILIEMTESCKARGERDNISSVWLKLIEGSRF